MSEKHEISQDVKIGRRFHDWKVFSKVSESSCRHGEVVLAAFEIDAIYAHIHKDDGPVTEPDPDDVKVADDEPKSDCRKCLYRRICKIVYQSANVCINYTLPEEWEEGEPEEGEKLVCGNCYYIDNVDYGRGYCFRYPPTEDTMRVSETTRACGEHRLRE